ncbi:hypothetical protein EAG_10754 [Camponotus floridanus]|uniref:Uncharacterized protein n=1 Tax=Camponotus floridanus TaxID=104421 RepID=E2AXK9_CAMFO|nr:uncharacterized protein LOC105257126 [Camponotus floridanus]EFN61847.1 hypothetical protein EAG_10754 [Camponotus floridanus]
MIVCRGTLWIIAVLILLSTCLLTSTKPQSRLTTKALHQQQRSRTKAGLVKAIYKNHEDEFTRSRTRRNHVGDYTLRNTSDYYAERRAIMERYYARQREINAQYANRTSSILGSRRNNVASQHRPMTRNATLLNLGLEYPNKNSKDRATLRYPYIRIDPLYGNESWDNGISIESDNRGDIAPETNFGFKSDANLSQTRNTSNLERNALDYITPTPCTNVSLSGTYAPKVHTKYEQNYTHETEQKFNRTNNNNNSIESDYQNWGTCEGKIVYQHNLLLGLKGPSNLDTLFEVIIQGPICITCVEVLRYNETRATVTLDSGGRGHEYVKIRLKGYENEGFSYIIKVWGVKKIGQNCDN